jgi:alginate production protein
LYSAATLDVTNDTTLTGFILRETNRSTLPELVELVELVDSDTVDEQDRMLTWRGFTLKNESISTPLGFFSGIINGSFVQGTEHTLVLEDVELDQTDSDIDLQNVTSINQLSVSAWAASTSITFEVPLYRRPKITIGYATGSGTPGLQPATSGSYRESSSQTYGELYGPELMNIEISSLGIYSAITDNIAFELSHYRFSKRNSEDGIGETELGLDQPLGLSSELGSETDVSIYLGLTEQLDVSINWSKFNSGSAYIEQTETSSQISLEVYFQL